GIIHGATKNHFRNLIWSQGVWHYCGLELNLFGDPEMNVHLTSANEPYVYVSDKVLDDANSNGLWDPGEYAELTVTLSNGGSVNATNVQAVLRATTNSQYVDISDSTSTFGTINVGSSANNSSDPYTMTADPGTPNGTVIGFTLHITADGGFSWDHNFTYAVGNPPVDYYDHDIGNVKYSVTNRGICGFLNDSQTQGSGFYYPKTGSQHLFIGSVWAGNSASYVVNRDYSAENSGDWQPTAGVFGDGTVYSDQDSWAKYDDSGMSSPKDLTCLQDGWSWSDVGGEDYVIVRYIFANEGSSAINGLYFGQFMDLDIGDAYNNSGGVDLSRNLIYMYGSGTKYAGVGLLDPSTAANVSFIKNDTYVYPNSCILDSDKIQFLNGSISTQTASPWDDWSICVSAGPFNLNPGDSAIFAVVVLGGEGVSDVQANYDSAAARYLPVGIAEKPDRSTPVIFTISKTYPEPFSSIVTIEYMIPKMSSVSLCVYDISGRLIKTIMEGKQKPGTYRANWDGKISNGRRAASGVYFCRLVVDGNEHKATKKLLLVK
ncbi:T9SS type A sorting domain-containing protein, partial [candidate division WOR-3 bacterium]|nr:T9SS type A sorting domain-containing protein [candidate division WOR-3 bacterium]